MHRDHRIGPQLSWNACKACSGIHMHVAFGRCLVGADRQQRDLDVAALRRFPETLEIRRVAAMKDRAPGVLDRGNPPNPRWLSCNTARPNGGPV